MCKILIRGEKSMAYREILTELKKLQARGITLELNGKTSYPEAIARAHCVCESKGTYGIMRDYIMSEENGTLQEIHFDYVKNPKW